MCISSKNGIDAVLNGKGGQLLFAAAAGHFAVDDGRDRLGRGIGVNQQAQILPQLCLGAAHRCGRAADVLFHGLAADGSDKAAGTGQYPLLPPIGDKIIMVRNQERDRAEAIPIAAHAPQQVPGYGSRAICMAVEHMAPVFFDTRSYHLCPKQSEAQGLDRFNLYGHGHF